jgi:hypothetical protein
MSEAELHWLHCRLVGGKLDKAPHGTLRFRLPVGLVDAAAGQSGFEPDEEIAHAVRQVFEVFATSTSAVAVVKHVSPHGVQLPDRLWQRERNGAVVWRPRRHARVLAMLHNPFYAGAYVYGAPSPGSGPCRAKRLVSTVTRARSSAMTGRRS